MPSLRFRGGLGGKRNKHHPPVSAVAFFPFLHIFISVYSITQGQMAAVRTMLSAAREEAAIISTELATTARTATIEVSRTAEMEMNPNVVRQAIKASVKQGSTMEGAYFTLVS